MDCDRVCGRVRRVRDVVTAVHVRDMSTAGGDKQRGRERHASDNSHTVVRCILYMLTLYAAYNDEFPVPLPRIINRSAFDHIE